MNIVSLVTFAVLATVMLLVFRALLVDLFKDLKRHSKKSTELDGKARKKKSPFRVIR